MSQRLYLLLFYLGVSSLEYCCQNNSANLRKLSVEEDYLLTIDKINNGVENLSDYDILVKDSSGRIISKDSIAKIDLSQYAFDSYVDKNNCVRLQVLRHITEEDRLAKKKWDSLLINDREFLIKFIASIKADSTEKESILEAYNSMAPLKNLPINCDSLADYLENALDLDQGNRSSGRIDAKVDRSNQELLVSIINKCGFEAIEETNEKGIQATFYIIQHANKELRERYFPQLDLWTRKSLMPASELALMIDRMKVDNNEEQIFGSQVRIYNDGRVELYKIKDMERVDIRRDSVGLGPLSEYLKHYGIDWETPSNHE